MSIPYRQVHLDFHTSPLIDEIGRDFDGKAFAETLQKAHVTGVTVFAKCHHGYSYHPAKAGEMHPHLSFDLLGEQLKSLQRAGIRACIYISAGYDERLAVLHPEWWVRDGQGRSFSLPDDAAAGYHRLCFNTEYMDILERQAEEVAEKYPCAGFFFDISNVVPCHCEKCLRDLRARGIDPDDKEAVRAFQEEVYLEYASRLERAVHKYQPSASVFHNGGHMPKGNARINAAQSHYELESLPTGGWGYDHFPLSALWAAAGDKEYLGMTGKFHTSWGEFGGYKHPNALLYEVLLSAALGAKCSVGDQLHPLGKLDAETYKMIGGAYGRLEEIEPYLQNAEIDAEVGLVSYESVLKDVYFPFGEKRTAGDVGCARILLEKHELFHVVDADADFSRYRMIVLPDRIRAEGEMKQKLKRYVAGGGKILATGESLLDETGQPIFPLGAKVLGKEEYSPVYCRMPAGAVAENEAAYVFYSETYRTEGASGAGTVVYPYFNRTKEHFCSHLHAPYSEKTGGCVVYCNAERSVAWIPLRLFEEYARVGSYFCKQLFSFAADMIFKPGAETDLPAQGIFTRMRVRGERRELYNLLYASPVKRGEGVEVIEDIPALTDIAVRIAAHGKVREILLLPQNAPLAFSQNNENVRFTLPKLSCHQLVAVDFED